MKKHYYIKKNKDTFSIVFFFVTFLDHVSLYFDKLALFPSPSLYGAWVERQGDLARTICRESGGPTFGYGCNDARNIGHMNWT